MALAASQIINHMGFCKRKVEPKDLLLKFGDDRAHPDQRTLWMKLMAWKTGVTRTLRGG